MCTTAGRLVHRPGCDDALLWIVGFGSLCGCRLLRPAHVQSYSRRPGRSSGRGLQPMQRRQMEIGHPILLGAVAASGYWPRPDIERHFAWMKCYIGLKYFQCYTWMRVTQYVLLIYAAALAVALASYRYQRPELSR